MASERMSLAAESARVRGRLDRERLSGRESTEIRHRVEAALAGDRQGWLIGMLASGALCTLAVWMFVALRVPAPGESERGCMREHAGFIDIDPRCTEPVSIERHGDIILAHAGAHLEESTFGMRVRDGKVSFVVRKREGGQSLRVLVSHGDIEVTGTRFTVMQEAEQGKVRLDEGSITFHWAGGGESALAVGNELEWPKRAAPVSAPVTLNPVALEAPKEPTPPPVAPPKPPTPRPAPQPKPKPVEPQAAEEEEEEEEEAEGTGPMPMEDVLKKMSTLRSQHRYREAVELLRTESARDDFSPAQQARLSFEIGLLLQDRMDDKASACAHWKQHARKYPDDASHADRVQESIKACEEGP